MQSPVVAFIAAVLSQDNSDPRPSLASFATPEFGVLKQLRAREAVLRDA